MTTSEQKLITKSGREYPSGWGAIYDEPMSYKKAMLFILKMSLWNITFKPTKRVSIWLMRLINPFVWLMIYALGQGAVLPFAIVGFFAIILSVLLFEYTEGMEHRLILIWGAAVPLVLMLSPLIALFVMGGGNKEGLGKHSTWNDQTSIVPLNQIKTGREYSKR